MVKRESIFIVSRDDTESKIRLTSSVGRIQQQRDKLVVVRVTLMFSRRLMTSSTLIRKTSLTLSMCGVC